MDTTWNDEYHLLFIDQPIGVGWTIKGETTNVNNTYDAADDFYSFIKQFYAIDEFKMLMDYDLFIFGESFAGSYIPVFAERILKGMEETILPLKGNHFKWL